MMMMNERQLAPATGFQANLLLRGPPRHNSITTGRVTWRPNRCSAARGASAVWCLTSSPDWQSVYDVTAESSTSIQRILQATTVLSNKMHSKLYFTEEELVDNVERWYKNENTGRGACRHYTAPRKEKNYRICTHYQHNINCCTHYKTVERYEVSSTNCKQENVNANVDLFIYLKSTTEGPEGHLYCQRNTTNKNGIKQQTNTKQHTVQTDKYEYYFSIKWHCTAQTVTDALHGALKTSHDAAVLDWQLAMHCHLRPPVPSVVLGFNHKVCSIVHQPSKFQQNRAMRGWVIDAFNHFHGPFSGGGMSRMCHFLRDGTPN